MSFLPGQGRALIHVTDNEIIVPEGVLSTREIAVICNDLGRRPSELTVGGKEALVNPVSGLNAYGGGGGGSGSGGGGSSRSSSSRSSSSSRLAASSRRASSGVPSISASQTRTSVGPSSRGGFRGSRAKAARANVSSSRTTTTSSRPTSSSGRAHISASSSRSRYSQVSRNTSAMSRGPTRRGGYRGDRAAATKSSSSEVSRNQTIGSHGRAHTSTSSSRSGSSLQSGATSVMSGGPSRRGGYRGQQAQAVRASRSGVAGKRSSASVGRAHISASSSRSQSSRLSEARANVSRGPSRRGGYRGPKARQVREGRSMSNTNTTASRTSQGRAHIPASSSRSRYSQFTGGQVQVSQGPPRRGGYRGSRAQAVRGSKALSTASNRRSSEGRAHIPASSPRSRYSNLQESKTRLSSGPPRRGGFRGDRAKATRSAAKTRTSRWSANFAKRLSADGGAIINRGTLPASKIPSRVIRWGTRLGVYKATYETRITASGTAQVRVNIDNNLANVLSGRNATSKLGKLWGNTGGRLVRLVPNRVRVTYSQGLDSKGLVAATKDIGWNYSQKKKTSTLGGFAGYRYNFSTGSHSLISSGSRVGPNNKGAFVNGGLRLSD